MPETLVEIKRREREKKLREARKRQKRTMAAAVAVFILFILLAVFFLSSDYFKIKTVNFSKTVHVSSKTLAEAEKILRGKNIFRAPVKKAAEVLLRDPWVKEANIKRKLPDKIEVVIAERKPAAQIAFEGFYYLVSDDGMVLERRHSPEDIVQIADLPVKTVKVGRALKIAEFESAMKVYKGLDSELRQKVLVISAPSADRIIFYLGGIEVIFGQAEYLDEKIKILKEILKREGDKAISIDLRVPDNPIVKVKP